MLESGRVGCQNVQGVNLFGTAQAQYRRKLHFYGFLEI